LCSKVTGGILVPIEDQAAASAVKYALGKGQISLYLSAPRAGLARGIEGVGDIEVDPGPGTLIRELAAELAQAQIGQGSGDIMDAHQIGDPQVLDCQRSRVQL
jgi:hypothetical protein